MATKPKNTGLSKCTGDPGIDTGQVNDENSQNAMFITNTRIMNGTSTSPDENSPQLWGNTENTDNRRLSHNITERKRKDKIKKCINHIAGLLPPLTVTSDKQLSTVETMERAAKFIKELKDQYERLLLGKADEVQGCRPVDVWTGFTVLKIPGLRRLLSDNRGNPQIKKEVEDLRSERDNYVEILKNAGISIDSQWKATRKTGIPNGDALQMQIDNPKEEEKQKGKSKRKTYVSSQLENARQQEQATNQAMGNVFQGMFGGLNNQMINSTFPIGNQVLMTPNGQVVMPMNSLSNGQNMMMDKSANGLGLLQMAMQDAGISELSRQPSPDNSSSREGSQSSNENLITVSSSIEDPDHALQTLASVASNPQNAVLTSLSSGQQHPNKSIVAQNMSPSVNQMDMTEPMSDVNNIHNLNVATSLNSMPGVGSNTNLSGVSLPGQLPVAVNNSATITNTTAVCSTAPPIMSVGQQGFNPMQQGNMMVNMAMNPNQINLMPNMGMGGMFMNAQGQLIMVNEQGVPIMAGVPNAVPPDQQQTNVTLPNTKPAKKEKNAKKGVPGQIPMPPNVLPNGSVSDQMGYTSVMTSQGQMNILQPMQQNPMMQHNMMQSIPLQSQQQMSLPGNQNVFQQPFPNQTNPNPGIILPANQNGNLLTLNTMPSQPNQLPSALILPNGQLIPVVQNPQSLVNNQQGTVLTSGGQVVSNNASVQMPMQQMGVGMPNTVLGNMPNMPNMDLNNQMLLGPQGFPIGSPAQMQQSSMGIILPNQFNTQQPISTSAQMVNNTVMASSTTQSVMTPQIQNTMPGSGLINNQKTAEGQTQSAVDVSMMPRNPVPAGVRAVVPDTKVSVANQPTFPGVNPGLGAPGPPIGPNGSILLTLPIEGQQVTVLVDPVTMQVLGIPPASQSTASTSVSTVTSTTTSVTAPLSAPKKAGGGGKKAPKLCPKQPSAKKTKSKSSPTQQQESIASSEPMVTECSQNTVSVSSDNQQVLEHGLNSEESASMTDILAKAAEAVGFYNPANEDNPLHIDTSAGDTEEEGSASPKKNLKTPESLPKSKPMTEDISPPLNMDCILKSPEDALSINIPTEEEFKHTAEACMTPPSKKSKTKSKVEEDSLDTPKIAKKSSKKKKKVEATPEDPTALHTPTLNGPFDIPEEITFSEAQLSDVLDQVEKLDSSFTETPPKKSNKKKSKSDDADMPVTKKRKKSGKDKSGSAGVQHLLPEVTPPVSQPTESRLSIYDFQDDSPPEVSPVRKGILGSLNASKLQNEPSKGMKETQSISDNFDVLESVLSLSQTLNMKPESDKNTSKSPRTKSKSKKKKSKTKTKEVIEPEVVSLPPEKIIEPQEKPPPSPTPEQEALALEQSLDSLLKSQNVDLSQTNDLVPASLAKMIDPLDDLTPITSSSPIRNPTPPPMSANSSVQNTSSPTKSSNVKPPFQNPNRKEEVLKPTSMSSRPQMDPPPLTHQPPRSDTSKHKTPPYQSPSQPQTSAPSKPSPLHTMHPSPQHQQQHQSVNQSQTTVPLSHHPNSQRSNTMVPPQEPFQHKSPAHQSPAHRILSPNTMGMRNSMDQANQSMVSPPNVTMGTGMRSNPDPNIISPPNVTMSGMDVLNVNPEQNIVSPPNINMGNNRSGHDSHPGFSQMNNMNRVPDASPIFPPPELPCSNEPLFPSPISSIPKLSHIETSPVKPPSRNSSGSNSDGPSQRSRNSIYSAENFVQSSPSRNSDGRQSQDNSQLSSCYGRSQPDSSESFNFTSIAMNLTSNTHSNSMADGMSLSSVSTPFSFSLTPSSSVASSALSSANNSNLPTHGPNPFYPPLHLNPPGQTTNAPDNSQHHIGNMNIPSGADMRNSRPHSRQMSNGPPNQNTFNFGMMDMGNCVSRESSIPPRLNLPGMDKNSHPDFRISNNSGGSNKRVPDLTPSRSMPGGQMDHNSRSQINSASYFPPTNFNQPPSSLTTPPLRHPPVPSSERSRLNHQPPFDPNFQPRGPALSSGPFGANRFENNNSLPRPPSSNVQFDSSSMNNTNMRKSSSNHNQKQSKQSHQSSGSVSAGASTHPMPPQNTSSQSTPLTHRDMPSTPAQTNRQKSQSRKQNSKKNKPQSFNPEMDTNLAHSIFDSNQGMNPYFSVPNLSPNPNRNLQGEGPSFLHGNLFGGSRPNNGPGPKNPDLGVPFNPFNPSRAQNTLQGLNFQPGFGMNHVSAASAPQITPHSGNVAMAPHLMSNFNLSNIFSDVNNSQSDSLNISPIKFPHGNHMLQQHGMDPNTLHHHHHQNSALYHNRGHPGQQLHNAMAINQLLGHNPHGFDVRPMGQGINTSVGSPFHGPGHPGSFGIPPLNFSLHDSH